MGKSSLPILDGLCLFPISADDLFRAAGRVMLGVKIGCNKSKKLHVKRKTETTAESTTLKTPRVNKDEDSG